MKGTISNDRSYSNIEVLKLAIAFDKSTQTIKRWILSKDDRLTSMKALDVLSIKKMK